MILLQPSGAKDINEFPYAIDRQPGDMTLEEQTKAGLDFLMKDNKKGFFLFNMKYINCFENFLQEKEVYI